MTRKTATKQTAKKTATARKNSTAKASRKPRQKTETAEPSNDWHDASEPRKNDWH